MKTNGTTRKNRKMGHKANWRKRDAEYRALQRKRRKANRGS